MPIRKLALALTVLTATGANAQYGMDYTTNPAIMMNPAMLLNPVMLSNPAMLLNQLNMMAPMGGTGGMNPVQYMSNPYLNPTSTMLPFLNPPRGGIGMGGNPYLMPPPQPRQQQQGFFPFMPAQTAPDNQGYGAPRAGYYPMMPSAAPTPAYGYGAPAYTQRPAQNQSANLPFFPFMPAQAAPAAPGYGAPQAGNYPMMPSAAQLPVYGYGAPANTQRPAPNQGAYLPFFPGMPATQAASQTAPQQAEVQQAPAPAGNPFNAATWGQRFPNPAPQNVQTPPVAPAPQPKAETQALPAGAPNYFDPNMWKQWMAPSAPK